MKNLIMVILAVIFIVTITEPNYSQVNQNWMKTYGASLTAEILSEMIKDKDGNLIVAGRSSVNPGSGFITIKYNSSGDTLWTRTYKQQSTIQGTDAANSIATDDSGNVFVTGFTTNTDGETDYTTVKYNSSGVRQWVQIYDGTSLYMDQATGIAVDASHNCYVTGISYETGRGSDYTTIKYSSGGDQIWINKFNYSWDDVPIAIALDIDGNIIITGQVSSSTYLDIVTVKYTPSGNEIWAEPFVTTFSDYPEALALDNEGNVFVVGSMVNSNFGQRDWFTVKIDSSGNTKWNKKYSGSYANSDDNMAKAVTADDIGNIYVTGYDHFNPSTTDFVTIKYNSNGDSVWVRKFDYNSSTDKATSIALDENKNVFVTGIASDYATTIKYSNSGEQLWYTRSNVGSSWYIKTSVVLDQSGSFYLCCTSGNDIVTIKYSQNPSLVLSALLQGFYDSSTDKMKSDTAKVFLRKSNSPFDVLDSAVSLLDSAGRGRFYFNNPVSNESYYLCFKHRNSIETWSSGAMSFASNEMNFDFTSAASRAFGNNQILSGTRFCLFSGDVDQNGTIDGEDARAIENDARNHLSGYVATDINCDGEVDGTDLSIADNNIFNYITAITPMHSSQFHHSGNLNNTKESGQNDEINLEQNYPNPFNPKTVISYSLSVNSLITLKVYDLSGKEVAALVNGRQDAGFHSVEFDGSMLSTGVYFYKIEAGNFTEVKKMTLIK